MSKFIGNIQLSNWPEPHTNKDARTTLEDTASKFSDYILVSPPKAVHHDPLFPQIPPIGEVTHDPLFPQIPPIGEVIHDPLFPQIPPVGGNKIGGIIDPPQTPIAALPDGKWSGPYPAPEDKWSGPYPAPEDKWSGPYPAPTNPTPSTSGVGVQLLVDGGFTVYIDENGNAVCGTPPSPIQTAINDFLNTTEKSHIGKAEAPANSASFADIHGAFELPVNSDAA